MQSSWPNLGTIPSGAKYFGVLFHLVQNKIWVPFHLALFGPIPVSPFQDDSVTFSKRHSLEEAIDMQDELDRMNLTLDNIRPPTLKLSTSETAKILLEPPTPVETDPMLRKSPPPKNFPVRASDSFLNL